MSQEKNKNAMSTVNTNASPAHGRASCRTLRYSRPKTQQPETLVSFLSSKFKYLSAEQWCSHIAAGHLLVNQNVMSDGATVLKQQDVIQFVVPPELEPEVDDKIVFLHVDADLVVMLKSGNIPVSEGGKYCAHTLRHVASKLLFTAATGGLQELGTEEEEEEEEEEEDGAPQPRKRQHQSLQEQQQTHSNLNYCQQQQQPQHPSLLFPVHRLDKETSGVVVMARSAATAAFLGAQFSRQQTTATTDASSAAVHKVYEAVLDGAMQVGVSVEVALNIGFDYEAEETSERQQEGVDAIAKKASHAVEEEEVANSKTLRRIRMRCFPPLPQSAKGKSARTTILPLLSRNNLTFARITIYTGRTHQIRCHCAAIGHPIVGEKLYRRDDETPVSNALFLARAKGEVAVVHPSIGVVPRHLLHAASLSFVHPRSQQQLADAESASTRKKHKTQPKEEKGQGQEKEEEEATTTTTTSTTTRGGGEHNTMHFVSSSAEWFVRDCPSLENVLFAAAPPAPLSTSTHQDP